MMLAEADTAALALLQFDRDQNRGRWRFDALLCDMEVSRHGALSQVKSSNSSRDCQLIREEVI